MKDVTVIFNINRTESIYYLFSVVPTLEIYVDKTMIEQIFKVSIYVLHFMRHPVVECLVH